MKMGKIYSVNRITLAFIMFGTVLISLTRFSLAVESLENCSLDINANFFIPFTDKEVSVDNVTIPLWKNIYLDVSCKAVSVLKYFFKLEYATQDKKGIYIKGIKVYWLFIVALFIVLYKMWRLPKIRIRRRK